MEHISSVVLSILAYRTVGIISAITENRKSENIYAKSTPYKLISIGKRHFYTQLGDHTEQPFKIFINLH